MSPDDLRPLLIIVVLLTVSGLFSAAELGFLAMGRRRARRAVEGRAAVILGGLLEAIAANWFLTGLHLPLWTAIVGMAVLLLIFAEVVPISYAAANPARVARATAIPIWVATRLLSLPARGIGFVAEWFTRMLGGGPGPERPITEGEFRAIVDLQAETGGLEEEEKVMIHQIFEFGETVAREVMIPRTDMVAIPEAATVEDAGRAATEHRISRLPVYRDNLDNIIGTVHVKDVIPLLVAGKREVPVTSVTLDPLRVPETKKLSDLLAEFRRRRRTLAIVMDEYGGTAGLVTLEDLLEEVVGDIYDEYDEVRPAIEHTAGGGVILDGRLSISEASAALGVELPEGEYDSLAGLLYAHLGVVPRTGDEVDVDGVQLVVDELDGHRIVRVRALLNPEPEEESTERGGG
jgi:CBS domain containing-hemolysin-like protein